jgi:cytochrome c556
MKKVRVLFIAALITGAFLMVGARNDLQAKAGALKEMSLPASLDSFYPPQSGQPVYLMSMLKLETYFSGIAADIMDNDIQGARNSFDEFRAQYMKILEMVPEWKGYYPVGPVDKLGAQLKEGDPGQVMEAFGQVGGICHECHISTMVQAQQKYHWGDFGTVKVTDPLSRESVDYALFKKFLSTNFAGISVNLGQGQPEQARKQLAGFRARFQALKGTCENCHDQENKYYVDENVEKTLDSLEKALSSTKVDPQAAGALVQSIGRQSCSKCHLVHVPAAMANVR